MIFSECILLPLQAKHIKGITKNTKEFRLGQRKDSGSSTFNI